ncbi:putative sensor histidine kinase [Magnetospirillum sp. XM-1]|uniref:sensor histidine kinase n=1 Tax=Magnetospirillum sp. XM-1 TaxID=1663591 RepID=UPI00073E08DC|nr:hybrid sensor histidine kinase/response regulator [Magnetospirillum sp. XM-1]CUW37195.1 putative sensor histidine kinase [Magnetospirillum sp. XM-1]
MQSEAAQPIPMAESSRPTSRRIRLLMVTLVGAAMAMLAGGCLFWIVAMRSEALSDADTSLRHTAHLLAETAATNFLAIDKVLLGTSEVAARQDRIDALLPFLRRQLAETPVARALLVIGPDGMSRAATNLPDPYKPVDLSDRPYFRHHQDASASALFVSGVIQSRNDNRWIMVLSRKIETPDGAFAGVVAATINLEHLSTVIKAAARTATDTALLVMPDGTILARTPDHERFAGQSLAASPDFKRIKTQPSGGGDTVSPLDGRNRLYAFHAALHHPVIAIASSDRSAVLKDWRRHSFLIAMAALLIGTVIATLTLLLIRQLERMDATLEELARSRLAADAASHAKSAFLANMSHELRTPLNAIIGFSDALIAGFPDHSCRTRCHDYLGHVQSSGHLLLALINDVLDLSKIEAGRMEIDAIPTAIMPLVRECGEIVRMRSEHKGVMLTVTGLDRDLMAMADPRRLRQILLNLLSNAVKFTPEGGRIILEADSDDRQLFLTVSDTGAGMTAEEIAVALTPFGQNPSEVAKAEAGTGLGLPLSKRLAEMHGGSLSVSSIPGRGTTVTVAIPLSQPPVPKT